MIVTYMIGYAVGVYAFYTLGFAIDEASAASWLLCLLALEIWRAYEDASIESYYRVSSRMIDRWIYASGADERIEACV